MADIDSVDRRICGWFVIFCRPLFIYPHFGAFTAYISVFKAGSSLRPVANVSYLLSLLMNTDIDKLVRNVSS